jgi:hypothetical protein
MIHIFGVQEAKKDLLAAAKLAPKDKAIREAVEQLKQKMKEGKQHEKEVWGGSLLQKEGESSGTTTDTAQSGLRNRKGGSGVKGGTNTTPITTSNSSASSVDSFFDDLSAASTPDPSHDWTKKEAALEGKKGLSAVVLSWPVGIAFLVILVAFILTHRSVRGW